MYKRQLIAWAEVYDKQINPSIEDAALLLNYMEGHEDVYKRQDWNSKAGSERYKG